MFAYAPVSTFRWKSCTPGRLSRRKCFITTGRWCANDVKWAIFHLRDCVINCVKLTLLCVSCQLRSYFVVLLPRRWSLPQVLLLDTRRDVWTASTGCAWLFSDCKSVKWMASTSWLRPRATASFWNSAIISSMRRSFITSSLNLHLFASNLHRFTKTYKDSSASCWYLLPAVISYGTFFPCWKQDYWIFFRVWCKFHC